MTHRFHNTAGFTLVELMIVVVIVGLLAGIAIPKYRYASWQAKEREADTILKQIYVSQESYRVRTGMYASTSTELAIVGFRAPDTLAYFVKPAVGGYSLPVCLASTGEWSSRQIDANGVLSDC